MNNSKKFIGYVISKLIENDICVILDNKDKISLGEKTDCNGWFSHAPTKELVIATKKAVKDWLPNFVHEYGHFMQWSNNTGPWIKLDKFEAEYPMDLDEWIKNNSIYKKTIVKKWMSLIRDVEIECEKITVDVIIDWKLPINIEEYIKKANAYVLFYNMMPNVGKWYERKAPYECKEVIDSMDSKFLTNYDKLPNKYEKLIKKHCLKK